MFFSLLKRNNLPARIVITAVGMLIGCTASLAQKNTSAQYASEAKALQKLITHRFYNDAIGFYREHAEASRDKNKASYLWPMCGMIQAANEMEVLTGNDSMLDHSMQVIGRYYDNRPPAPGYASYPPVLGGGDRFYDDNQWIGIALMDGYARKKTPSYLAKATEIYRFMMTAYDTVTGGGLYWEEGKLNTKNTCSNGPGIVLALQLYNATKKKAFLDTAILLYNWTKQHLMDTDGVYFDNIKTPSGEVDKRKYSYNAGTMMQSGIYLYEITRQKKYLDDATLTAEGALRYFYADNHFKDGYWFNAVLMRAYQHLLKHNKDLKYLKAIAAAANTALEKERNADGLFLHKNETVDLTNQAGILEILARLAVIGKKYPL